MWSDWLAPNPQAARGVSIARSVNSVLHVDANSFVVAVDACPVSGFASHLRAVHVGEDGGDALLAQGEQGGDGPCGQGRDDVAAGSAGLVGPFCSRATGALPNEVASPSSVVPLDGTIAWLQRE
jgi:hypothetical protein